MTGVSPPLDEAVREGFPEEVTFEQRGRKGIGYGKIWKEGSRQKEQYVQRP